MADRRSRLAVRPIAAALAALSLAGCAADYVGEDWQCPLAQGSVCASVAAADPAVSQMQVPKTLVPETRAAAAAGADCGSGCSPLAWLAGLFTGPAGSGQGEPDRADAGRDVEVGVVRPVDAKRISAAPAVDAPAATAGEAPSAAASLPAPESRPGETGDGRAAAAGHSASGGSAAGSPARVSAAIAAEDRAPTPVAGDTGGDPAAGDGALRTGEVVARIWIAPFVDAEGIYREGSWVRAVITPAAWRLP